MNDDKKKYVIAASGVIITILIIVVLLVINKNNNTGDIKDYNVDIQKEIDSYSGKVIGCQESEDSDIKYVLFLNKNGDKFTKVINSWIHPIMYYGFTNTKKLTEQDKEKLKKELYFKFGIEYKNYDGINISIDYLEDDENYINITLVADYDKANQQILSKLDVDFNSGDDTKNKIDEILKKSEFNCKYIK